MPEQISATSHGPADGRQAIEDWRKPSAGQITLVPVQVSATSHGPADARHTVDAGAMASAGQEAPDPVHVSARSQGPPEARQTVDADAKLSGGQPASVPSQTSTISQGPADARQTVPVGFAGLEHSPVLGSHVPALWQTSLALQTTLWHLSTIVAAAQTPGTWHWLVALL